MIRADGLRKLHLAEFRDRPVECEWKIVNFIQNVKVGAVELTHSKNYMILTDLKNIQTLTLQQLAMSHSFS